MLDTERGFIRKELPATAAVTGSTQHSGDTKPRVFQPKNQEGRGGLRAEECSEKSREKEA